MQDKKYCICCGSPIQVVSEWDARNDYRLEHDGVIELNICTSTKCSANIEVRDLYILDEDKEEKSIKYFTPNINGADTKIENINTIVNRCIHCGEHLDTNEVRSIVTDDNDEGILTNKICLACNTSYNIMDLYNIEDIHSDTNKCIDIYDSRTIIIN